MHQFDFREVPLQRLFKRVRQHRDTVLRSFAIAYGDLVVDKINIFHS